MIEQTLHSSTGVPLDAGTRAFFEPRFGRDFSAVRVHAGVSAAASARAVSADAYTVGRDIVFREGAFEPGADRGRRLLAHELTHVVQQGAAPPAPDGVQARGGSAGAGLGSASPGAAQRSEVCDAEGVCRSENDGVDESRSTSAQVPANSTSAPATSTAAPNSTPVAAALRPPGNCTQDQWYALQQVVKQNCKTNMPRACAEGDSPGDIADKAAHFARCIAARTTLNNTCFGGGDPGHLIELGNLTRGLARCERMRLPVPVPVPQPAPQEERRTSPAVDRGFMERMAAITGLSGAALIAYLVISEGSRLFPPRNLIPVP